jgi:hypothetical protein
VGSGPQLTLTDWQQALLEVLLPRGVNAGRPVLLACDDEAVRAAATRLRCDGDPVNGLITALQTEQPVSTAHGFDAAVNAARAFQRQSRPRTGPPPAVAAWCVCVLAASRMDYTERHTAGLYYPLLGELLGVRIQDDWPHLPGVDDLAALLDDLAVWLADDEQGRRGILRLPADPGRRVVGRYVSQTLLRGRDRGLLGDYFWRYGRAISAGWNPSRLVRTWGGRHHLTAPAQDRIADRRLDRPLSGALRSAYRSWDGTRVDEHGLRVWPVRLRLGASPRTAALHASIPAADGVVRVTAPDTSAFMFATHPQETILPLDWLAAATAGPLRLETAAGTHVEVFDSPTMLFELTDIGLAQVPLAGEQPVWALTCDPRLTGLPLPPARRHRASLPRPWALLVNLYPDELPDDLRQPPGDPDPDSDADIDVLGGLPLGLKTWLVDHPPALRSNLPEPALLRINQREHGDLDPGEVRQLQEISAQPGTYYLDVGDVWERELELAEQGRREHIGSLYWDLGHPTLARHGAGDGTHPLAGGGPAVCGAAVNDVGAQGWRPPLLLRVHATVHAIRADGSVTMHAPPSPPAWARASGIVDDIPDPRRPEPWAIDDNGQIVWLCIEHPQRPRVRAVRHADVPDTDQVLDLVDQFAAADLTADDGDSDQARARWRALAEFAEQEFADG